jgi:hypothetical protein
MGSVAHPFFVWSEAHEGTSALEPLQEGMLRLIIFAGLATRVIEPLAHQLDADFRRLNSLFVSQEVAESDSFADSILSAWRAVEFSDPAAQIAQSLL